MDSSTKRKPEARRYERRFLRNVFAAAFVGVSLGLLVAGAAVIDSLVIGVARALMAWGLIRRASQAPLPAVGWPPRAEAR